MSPPPAVEELAQALAEVPIAQGRALSVLTTKGISHDHWRIGDSGLVLRVPRMSQWGMAPGEQLIYEATAFQRAAASGHCPTLRETIPVGEILPRGALIVDLVDGRPPRLPDDLDAIADAFTAIHQLPIPASAGQPPLQVHTDPVAATLRVIEEQASFVADALLSDDARTAIHQELEWARGFTFDGEPAMTLCLVGTDTHPGNFLIDRDGKAWFVDLEKALYGVPPIDLAHATLAVATGWDPDCATRLTTDQVGAFYRRYLEHVGPARAGEIMPRLIPLRRLTWLRTMTWFARWQAAWQGGDHPASRDAAMTAHIATHIAASFEPGAIAQARSDWLETDLLDALI
ncbi:MAG: aminoglycoside phosphotransferase [Alphaproteobacteria bacterium]|nr:aminoglycoside phosphotransferase [Alphaproteobacteria bacterium]